MTRGQVTKYLREDDDAVYIGIARYPEMISVSDKLYASPKVAAKMTGKEVVKISKRLLLALLQEQSRMEEIK